MSSKKFCDICNRGLGLYAHNRQVYCDKDIRDCWKIGKAKHQKIINDKRYHPEPIPCKRCNKVVTENNMRKLCNQCIEDTGINIRDCKVCKKRKTKSQDQICKICKETIRREKRLQKDKEILTRMSLKKYQKEEIQSLKPHEVKEETFGINPKWLAPRGSKRKIK